jgi:aryl-alcohol dehydrogenase-like predicted oxidoreductase
MKHRQVGKSGLTVSVVGLGCNNVGNRISDDTSREVIHRALDIGVTLFDTADMYGPGGNSEKVLGKILGNRRRDVVIATKFGKDEKHQSKGASRRYIMEAVEGSLRRLQTDWIDLYQIHAPDPLTPIEETLRALDDLIQSGKVRYIGCSNFAAWQMVEAYWTAREIGLNRPISCQNEYSLVVRNIEQELVPAMKAYGVGLLPYFPLASGLLTGKYRASMPDDGRLTKLKHLAKRFMTDENLSLISRLEEFCQRSGLSLLEVAFGWLASREAVSSIIAGATTSAQVEQNVSAADALTGEQCSEIDAILQPAGSVS